MTHRSYLIFGCVFSWCLSASVLAHEGHQHAGKHKKNSDRGNSKPKTGPSSKAPDSESDMPANAEEQQLLEIAQTYKAKINPLFRRACADCHSGDTRYPWYYIVPGIRQWMEHAIAEGREHIEISNGFPFQSHAGPVEDLQAIEKVLREGTMPPFSYRLMHAESRLSAKEKQTIVDWARQGQNLLKNAESKDKSSK